ncbi:hypothetical protein Tco_0926507 [Tanacetum coccineum]|uniref:Uncharacterized protein n=1 Tax=Tanacetum coccineum TaxID=301880 RepID=A0ABQ5DCS7_9ASTR
MNKEILRLVNLADNKVAKTNEIMNKEIPRLVNLAVNKNHEVDPINVQEMISKEFEVFTPLKNLETKIDSNVASTEDNESRIKLLHEIDKIDNLESLDLLQRSHIKWDIEGDENSKFFHGLLNQTHRTNSTHGIMHEDVWIAAPPQVKEIFLNFFKEKFQPYDSMSEFPPISFPSNLSPYDHELSKKEVSLDEIKSAV